MVSNVPSIVSSTWMKLFLDMYKFVLGPTPSDNNELENLNVIRSSRNRKCPSLKFQTKFTIKSRDPSSLPVKNFERLPELVSMLFYRCVMEFKF